MNSPVELCQGADLAPNCVLSEDRKNESAAKGIFWIVEREELQKNEPYLFRVPLDDDGEVCHNVARPPLNSKRGDNYVHERTWNSCVPSELRRGKAYNYYPRGRVELKNGDKAIIFLNPDIATDEIVAYIIEKFRLDCREVKVVADGSAHYAYLAADESNLSANGNAGKGAP